jgi:actin-related protein 5
MRIGSSTWRAGFSTMSDPYIDRPNMVSRYKEKKFGRQYMLFGKDGDVDAMSRSSQRAMFDGDLLIQADILVRILFFN